MPTFIAFTNLFLQRFSTKRNEEIKITTNNNSVQMSNLNQDDVFGSLRSQLLLSHIEKLPKFDGKLNQSLSKWLGEIQEAMNMLKLTDAEKLFYISLCLEGDAFEWFLDNKHLFLTWAVFIEKFIKIFRSSRNDDHLFDELCHFEHGINENTTNYGFEFMKLHQEKKNTTTPISRLNEQNRSTIHSTANKKNNATTTNIITEDTNMVIGSVKADLVPPVPQHFSAMNQIDFEIKEETLNSEDKRETSTIKAQNVNSVPVHDESFNVLNLEKLMSDDINVISDDLDVFKNFGMKNYDSIIAIDTVFIGTQYSLNMHNESMITEIRRQTNITTTTPMILLKIKI
ncbi:unnamed protein product, partial [Rotaria socialis]